MPSVVWVWAGVCLWTIGFCWLAGSILGELRSIGRQLERLLDRIEENP